MPKKVYGINIWSEVFFFAFGHFPVRNVQVSTIWFFLSGKNFKTKTTHLRVDGINTSYLFSFTLNNTYSLYALLV